jgi:adenylate cyclase
MAQAPIQNLERRQATVLFADLSGFTAFCEGLDPEDVAEATGELFRAFEAVVKSHDGYLDKFMGDAVMAVFGAPVAHEDDPVRAVSCAMSMLEALAAFNVKRGTRLPMRIGINTGEVIAGRPTENSAYTVQGDAVNVAQRLESAANPGAILVGRTTQKLSSHRFIFKMLPPVQVKNRKEPVQPYEVADVGASGHSAGGEAPLVGRAKEVGLLKSVFRNVTAERTCRCVHITGDAGAGKSRLLAEFREWVADEPGGADMLRGACAPYGGGALGPFREMIRRRFDVVAGTNPDEARLKLTAGLGELFDKLADSGGIQRGIETENMTHLVGLMIGIEFPEARIMAMPAENRRAEGFNALRLLFEALAIDAPLFLEIEDSHWADESSAALLSHLHERLAARPVLFIVCGRAAEPDGVARALSGRNRVQTLKLEALGKEEVTALLEALAGTAPAESVIADVMHRTGGNPYFVTELAKFLAEKGLYSGSKEAAVASGHTSKTRRLAKTVGATVVPDTLDGLLAAKIDVLPLREKYVYRHAAVIGSTFWAGSVEHLGQQAGTSELEALVAKALVARHGASMIHDEREFAFVHALLRDAAYKVLSRKERATLHGLAADWLEKRLEGAPVDILHLAAYHNTEAGRLDKAREQWEKAGDSEKESGCVDEAANCYTAALELIPAVGEASQSPAARRRLLGKRAGVLDLMAQYRAAIADIQEAFRLAADATSRSYLISQEGRLRRFLGETAEAKRLYEAAIAEAGEAASLEKVDAMNSLSLLMMSTMDDLEGGERIAKDALAFAASLPDFTPTGKPCRASAVALCKSTLGHAAMFRGNPDAALVLLQEALQGFTDLKDTRNIARTHAMIGNFHADRSDWAKALEAYNEEMRIGERIGDRRLVASGMGHVGNIYCAQAYRNQREWTDALHHFRRFLEASRRMGYMQGISVGALNVSCVLSNIGEQTAAAGRSDEARALFLEAVELGRERLANAGAIGWREGMAMAGENLAAALGRIGEKAQAIIELKASHATWVALGRKEQADITLKSVRELEGMKD